MVKLENNMIAFIKKVLECVIKLEKTTADNNFRRAAQAKYEDLCM